MSKPFSTYEASDYAGIDVPSKRIKLYYGYEVTTNDQEERGDGDWCFEATFPDGKVTIPFPALKMANDEVDSFECVPCLMTGIAILIERGDLKP